MNSWDLSSMMHRKKIFKIWQTTQLSQNIIKTIVLLIVNRQNYKYILIPFLIWTKNSENIISLNNALNSATGMWKAFSTNFETSYCSENPGKQNSVLQRIIVGYPTEFSLYLGYVPLTRQTVQRQLKRLMITHSKHLYHLLSNIPHVAVTCDFWSDKKMRSYLCLTVHYIDKSRPISKVLSFNAFDGSHDNVNIAEAITNELKRYNVFEKCVTITCDGGSNIKKSFFTSSATAY